MHIQEQEGRLGLMELQCHCKPWGFKQGCEEGLMIQTKISNGSLTRNTRFKRGQSSHGDVQYRTDSNTPRAKLLIGQALSSCKYCSELAKKVLSCINSK